MADPRRFQEIVHQCKHDWSFQFGEKESSSALYIEPMIICKAKYGSFENVTVESLFELYPLKTVILYGDSGSGKSFIAQKRMLDWASGKVFSSYVAFYLKCEEMGCIYEQMNFIELLSCSCSLTSEQISQVLLQTPEKVLFIIDGLDELRLTQDIYEMSTHAHPLEKASPEVLLCALLRRFIIPESRLLVTTRTKHTVNKLMKEQKCFSEIMGFNVNEVEMHFQKLLSKKYDLVKSNEFLFTACSTPVICWIISEIFRVSADLTSGLETTTSIYIEFVSTLLERHSQSLSQSVPTLLRSLGRLAERGMMDQQVLFEEKYVNITVSDPTDSPFLSKFLSKRSVHQKTMFSFIHRSFQEFFSALYYVILDEDESQRKVKDLLHTVERGWVLSCWSHTDLSRADEEVRRSELLQPVILFLCGLCKKETIPSFFQKHNISLSVNIETQLKDWISQCSLRYQNEHMLFILHCLYELHEKSFTGKVLEGLILMDLSNIPLKRTDCWVLKYCLQSCEHITHLKLQLTSDHLKMLQPELYRCQELWLMVDHISDVVDLVLAAAEGKSLKKLNVKWPEKPESKYPTHLKIVSVRDGDIMLAFSTLSYRSSVSKLTLTSPHSFISFINWIKSHSWEWYRHGFDERHENRVFMFLKSLPDLKKVCLHLSDEGKMSVSEILSLIQACPSLIELMVTETPHHIYRLNVRPWSMDEIQSLEKPLKQMGWTLNISGESVLIKADVKRITEEELKIKKKKIGEPSVSKFFSSRPESSSAQSCSEDAEIFTPDLIKRRDEEKHRNTYRFVCPRAGQFRCSLTSLVFVVEAEAELLYKTLSWDPRLLDGLGQMQPAGPLYNIDCFKGSISQLHLPHCEILSEYNKEGLAVAHFTDGNVEIIQPLNVSETHVMIDIKDLSSYGLAWINNKILGRPVSGQVLLFLRTLNEKTEKILNVHLLPGNVSVSELRHWHQDKSYIETSSKCRLFLDKEYSLLCYPEECLAVQPKSEIFDHSNFVDRNYHPTFEVFLDVNAVKVRLGVLDKTENGKEVWETRQISLTASSRGVESPAHRRNPECDFVDKHRDKLIERVSSPKVIADGLKVKKMITNQKYSNVCSSAKSPTPQDQTRELLSGVDSGGAPVKAEFHRLLKENEPQLVNDLEAGAQGS